MAADELRGPLVEFLVYCNEERERCRNSGEEFDEDLFNEAVDVAERNRRPRRQYAVRNSQSDGAARSGHQGHLPS